MTNLKETLKVLIDKINAVNNLPEDYYVIDVYLNGLTVFWSSFA